MPRKLKIYTGTKNFIHNIKDSKEGAYSLKTKKAPESELSLEKTEQKHTLPKICFIKGDTVKKKKNLLFFKDKKILALSLIRNCCSSFKKIKKFITDLEKHTLKTNFYFFTNNNTDKSQNILQKWIEKTSTVSGIFGPEEKITLENRIIKLAEYRNLVLRGGLKYFGKAFDYIIIFDSDLSDKYIESEDLLKSISEVPEPWSIISGNSCYKDSNYYYDLFAMRLKDQSDKIYDIYPNFFEHFGKTTKWIDKLYIFDGIVEVKTAFGGISIYKASEILEVLKKTDKNIYELQDLHSGDCEHISLSNRLSNKKYIHSDLKYYHSQSLEGDLMNNAYSFVPRDAGFFSVFNFYIGSLASGDRVYPYFNKKSLLLLNQNINDHFCYWTDKDNCWFDYFEKVSFYEKDNTHEDVKQMLFFRMTNGSDKASDFFRFPKETEKLISNEGLFSKWRKEISPFYKKYIRFNKDIIKGVDSFWSKNKLSNNTIGVHYRHPSHSIESGQLYLKQYFDEVDKRLDKNSTSDVFLASDNDFGILAFKQRYKDKIKYIEDIKRLDLDNFLAWSFSLANRKAEVDSVGFIGGKGLELHHTTDKNINNKKMTQDLLKEVICLSRCDSLICSQSNISLALSYMNTELEMIFLKQENKENE